jgi:hypothetical protein
MRLNLRTAIEPPILVLASALSFHAPIQPLPLGCILQPYQTQHRRISYYLTPSQVNRIRREFGMTAVPEEVATLMMGTGSRKTGRHGRQCDVPMYARQHSWSLELGQVTSYSRTRDHHIESVRHGTSLTASPETYCRPAVRIAEFQASRMLGRGWNEKCSSKSRPADLELIRVCRFVHGVHGAMALKIGPAGFCSRANRTPDEAPSVPQLACTFSLTSHLNPPND